MIAVLTDEQRKELSLIEELIEYHAADLRSFGPLSECDDSTKREYELIEQTIKQLQARQSDIQRMPTDAEARLNALMDEHILVLKRAIHYVKQLDYIRKELTQDWPIDERDPVPSVNQIKLEILCGMEYVEC